MKLSMYVGVSVIGLTGALSAVPDLLKRGFAVHAANVMVPKFEVDPYWPKPLPNHRRLGGCSGSGMDHSPAEYGGR
jgi:hypothetical protein